MLHGLCTNDLNLPFLTVGSTFNARIWGIVDRAQQGDEVGTAHDTLHVGVRYY